MNQRAWMLVLLLLLVAHSPATAHNSRSKSECTVVKEKIRTIQSKMRSGYTRAQGERYEEQLRQLRAKRFKICR
jgi:hypothetical protein